VLWPLARDAGDGHEPAHALHHLVEPRPVLVRAFLAEAGDAAVDEARIHLLHRLVVDTEAVLHFRAVVLDDDVGFLRHALEYRQPLGGLEIQREAPAVPLQVLEIEAVAPLPRAAAAVLFVRVLDLDDVGAEVGELACTGRSGARAG